jgi:hypothetical protein
MPLGIFFAGAAALAKNQNKKNPEEKDNRKGISH